MLITKCFQRINRDGSLCGQFFINRTQRGLTLLCTNCCEFCRNVIYSQLQAIKELVHLLKRTDQLKE